MILHVCPPYSLFPGNFLKAVFRLLAIGGAQFLCVDRKVYHLVHLQV